MSFVMGSPITMLIVFCLFGTQLLALRRIALMACSILSDVGVDEGSLGGSNAEWWQPRGRCFLNEEPVPVLLCYCKNAHVALLRRLLFYVYAIAGKPYGWDDKHCFLMLNIC